MFPLRPLPLLVVLLFVAVPIAGCLSDAPTPKGPAPVDEDPVPALDHVSETPDLSLRLVQESTILPGDGVTLHGRTVRPEGDGPFPVIIQFTPYTAPGRNADLNDLIEPNVHDATGTPLDLDGTYVKQFVRRGYAFVFADVRGTGDSSGCLDLRGQKDIADLYHLIEHYGTVSWSNGKVGFIGASYPGSTSHMAALAGNPHLKAVVPVVASTSFYHYHHNDGVPYNGNHALGGTNSAYTAFATAPTVNPQEPNYVSRHIEETECPHLENMVEHGGMDQTGAYYDWWQDRNLRTLVDRVEVPVLMAQGLADWNVKPDHIATWYNDLSVPKTLIAGQWGHSFPASKSDECESYDSAKRCDPAVPYGDWWNYVSVFFDTHLKGIETGMFETDVAWVQADDGSWHRSADWPIQGGDEIVFHLTDKATLDPTATDVTAEYTWHACPRDEHSKGQTSNVGRTGLAADHCAPGESTALYFETDAFENATILSGVPLLDITLRSTSDFAHLVWVLERIDEKGEVIRENHGYLNPTYRHGIDNEMPVPTDTPYTVTIDGYPQEDVIKQGERLRLTIRSHDDGRTIESFRVGTNTLVIGPDAPATFTLPVRPDDLKGVRLAQDAG